ncbi:MULTISPECIES: protein kinase domain-containing protein [unclassified Frankia]|uniref:protein kinase domain-containing protein n=1 Tax=unclassified Frankia TaxID=2632575 RepID=UPI002AD1E717|nr:MULTISPECIES: hypothetical protein [unclassified Frankia]
MTHPDWRASEASDGPPEASPAAPGASASPGGRRPGRAESAGADGRGTNGSSPGEAGTTGGPYNEPPQGRSDALTELSYITTYGEREQLRIRVGEWEEPGGRSPGAARPPSRSAPYRRRRLTNPDSNLDFVQKILPKDQVTADNCDLIDNEIQIGLHLLRMIGETRYPAELSRLVGYDADAQEPFILLAERGAPAGLSSRKMSAAKYESFQVSLFRALSILEAAKVVHRSLTPGTVRWNDPRVQITDFQHARLIGEPAGPAPSPRWAAPEARHGGVPADPAADLWSAGLVIVHVVGGPLPPGMTGPPDLRAVGGGLDRTLDGVFAPTPPQRPQIELFMQDLHAERDFVPVGAYPEPVTADPRFLEGRRRFAELSRSKSRTAQTFDPYSGDHS